MKNLLKVYFYYIKKYKFSFFIGLFFIIIASIIQNIPNILIKDLIDSIENFDKDQVIYIAILMTGSGILTMFFTLIGNVIQDSYLIKTSRDLKLQIVDHLQKVDYKFHAETKGGKLISIIKRGDGAFWSLSLEIHRFLVTPIVSFLIAISVFYKINTQLAMIIASSLFLNTLGAILLVRINLKYRRRLNSVEDKITGYIADNILNFEIVAIFAQERNEVKRIKNKYRIWINRLWQYAITYRVIEMWTTLLSAVSIFLLIYISIKQVENSSMTTGDFAMVITFSITLFPKFESIIYRFRDIVKKYADLEKYLNILLISNEIKEKPNAKKLKIKKGKIVFENVTFKYQNSGKVLKNIDLTINPKETIAFVGESGVGKTTLVKLLFRFYDPVSGKILIDDQDLRDVTIESIRQNIGMVPQDVLLFNNSIKFNISYPKPNISLKNIKKYTKKAALDKYINSLEKEYDTIVGERGIKLSGGQRQRLAIARVLVENPKILILDEATSQLDSESERIIQKAFHDLAKDRTTIIIAHRLSTIMHVDKIVVLDKGRIVEIGKHDELLKKNGIYAKLWKIQTGGNVKS